MGYELIYDFKNNKHYNADFLSLIKRADEKSTYEEWMTKGHWDPNYIPFALIDDKNNIIAGVGVIKTHVFVKEHKYDAIQIGKIFVKDQTHRDVLQKDILEKIIKKYETIVDAIYSFENDFDEALLEEHGFKNPTEYKCLINWNEKQNDNTSIVKKINLENIVEYDHLLEEIKHSSRMSKVVATNGDALIKMYNILKYYPRNVFHVPSLDTTIVFTINDGIFKLISAFSKNEIDMIELLDLIVPEEIHTVEFGFIPEIDGVEITPRVEGGIDNHLTILSKFYVKSISVDFDTIKMMMPVLSREK